MGWVLSVIEAKSIQMAKGKAYWIVIVLCILSVAAVTGVLITYLILAK
jgi:hypothetical protein